MAVGATDNRKPIHRGLMTFRAIQLIRKLAHETDGQDLIEYGLLVGIITLASILALIAVGGKLAPYFTTLNAAMP
jgi:Flp pilus assembly pilin Flp